MPKVNPEIERLSLKSTYSIDQTFDDSKFIKLDMRIMHDLRNPNNSYFDLEDINKAKESIYNIPILANVIEDENGDKQFGGHDMTIEENSDGKYVTRYQERPIGVIPIDCNYEIKQYNGKNYVYASGYVWKGYANEAQDIIERDQDIKISVELAVDSYEYNAKEKYFKIKDYRYLGVTLLNKYFGTGMENALATTGTFSEDSCSDSKLKFIKMMEDLKETLSLYNQEKGGTENVAKTESKRKAKVFEAEVVAETIVGETVENTIETENIVESTDIVEEGVEDANVDVEETTEIIDEVKSTETTEQVVTVEEIESTTEEFQAESTETEAKFVKSFELSHDDIRYGLYQILSPIEAEDNEWYYIDQVYDTHFEYMNWDGSKIYRQKYNKKDDIISFEGDRIQLYQERLTPMEKEMLDRMRSEFELLSANFEKAKADLELLNSYKLEKEREEKEKVFSKFEGLTEEDLKEVKEKIDSYSLSQLEEKLLLVWAKKKMEFEKIKKESGKEDDVKDKLLFALANVSETNSDKNAPIYADIVSKYSK